MSNGRTCAHSTRAHAGLVDRSRERSDIASAAQAGLFVYRFTERRSIAVGSASYETGAVGNALQEPGAVGNALHETGAVGNASHETGAQAGLFFARSRERSNIADASMFLAERRAKWCVMCMYATAAATAAATAVIVGVGVSPMAESRGNDLAQVTGQCKLWHFSRSAVLVSCILTERVQYYSH